MTRRLACLLGCLSALLVPACQKDKVVAPALSATCEARPASGAVPLTVSFLVNVAGAEGPITVAISYGDGASGSNPDASHSYTAAGSYTASFDVRTATQSARCSAVVAVGLRLLRRPRAGTRLRTPSSRRRPGRSPRRSRARPPSP